MHKGWRIAAAMALAMLAATATAGDGAGTVRKQVEASMVITGRIEIDAGGRVVSYSVDRAEEVPPVVVDLMAKAVPDWTFEPKRVDGKPVPARSLMHVRVVARRLENGGFSASVRDAEFLGNPPPQGTYPISKRMVHPKYPASALRAGAGAAVYVVVKVGSDGAVEDAMTEQVNLVYIANEKSMEAARKLFSDAGLQAAKASTFSPPSTGEYVGKSTSVRIPYVFQVEGGTPVDVGYGQWAAYVPGPYHPAPWRAGELTSGSGDLLAAGAAAQPLDDKAGLHLLTRLGEEG